MKENVLEPIETKTFDTYYYGSNARTTAVYTNKEKFTVIKMTIMKPNIIIKLANKKTKLIKMPFFFLALVCKCLSILSPLFLSFLPYFITIPYASQLIFMHLILLVWLKSGVIIVSYKTKKQ